MPIQWVPLGSRNFGKSWAIGSYGASSGAKIAISTHSVMKKIPMMASGRVQGERCGFMSA